MNNLSIKAKLFGGAILSVAIIFAMAAVNFYSSKQGASALEEVYEHNVVPLVMLQTMDTLLKEVRFRMAGVLLDQMPIQGSRNNLKEAREKVPQIWLNFKSKTKEGQGKEHVAKIDKQVEPLLAFLDRLDKAYVAGDKDALGSLLSDDWPVVHAGMLKPIAELIPLQETSVKTTVSGGGELGSMADSVNMMVRQLHEIIGGVKGAADITGMVGQITSNTETAVKSMNEVKNEVRNSAQIAEATKDTLVEILEATKRVSALANHIASATHQQSSATENTASNMEMISQITSNNAGNVRSMAHTAESVKDTASRLQDLVGQFKL